MAKKFDIDAVTDPIIRQMMRQGVELKAVLKAAKGKTRQDIDQIRNWDRAQRGATQSNYRYNPDGTRVPHTDPNRRPHLPAQTVRNVWDRDRSRQVANWEAMGLPRRPGPDEMFVRDRQNEWVPVDRGSSRRRPWDMGHRPGSEFRDLHRQYLDRLDDPSWDDQDALDDFLAEFRRESNYTVQDRLRNQSHMDEA
ncbi:MULTISPECIES: GH-E family nuclease [unclassified Agrococcus]|uniref:GH-E family nuclease n=1 Tax=unclassified Agrococcus TaxID=2615065 RepID=UPI00360CA242